MLERALLLPYHFESCPDVDFHADDLTGLIEKIKGTGIPRNDTRAKVRERYTLEGICNEYMKLIEEGLRT